MNTHNHDDNTNPSEGGKPLGDLPKGNPPQEAQPSDAQPNAEQGAPLPPFLRAANGRVTVEPMSERQTLEMHICFLLDDIEAATRKAYLAMGHEAIRLLEHGGSTNPDVLRQHWQESVLTFKTEVSRIGEPTQQIITALKALLEI